ncbi:MAG: RNA-binding protein [Pseudomonadota bacterium]|nr:RNA-binding protein [Pseudomonadota bacterium]
MKIYVGNLSWGTSSDDLENLFAKIGTVESAQVITDRDSGRSRGFGFVEMAQTDGVRAVAELNGQEVDGRALRVNEAQSKPRQGGRF